MNRPIKGDAFRRGQYAHVMFQASANDVPNMRIKINEGSFWINNKTLIEYSGGQSPLIEAPLSGAKWVLVAINKIGKAVLYNGHAVPNNPDAPYVDKNVLPIAFIYIKSSTKVITNDMIYDARPLYAAGGYPEMHNLLDGRDEEDCHPIKAITGLQDALDNRLTLEDADEQFSQKADTDGTIGANFVLNKDDSGTPVEYCGLRVNRGAQPQVGIRYNEDEDQWQYTNDGTIWHPIGNDTDLSDLATQYTAGITQLSVDPKDAAHPIAVGDNDPRLLEIPKKVSKDELKAKYYDKAETKELLKTKANTEDVYNKSDAEAIFLTKAEFSETGGYTKDQLKAFFAAKANAASVYTRKEIDNMLYQYYDKTQVDKLLKEKSGCNCNCGAGAGTGTGTGTSTGTGTGTGTSTSVDMSKYYTAAQVDSLLSKLNYLDSAVATTKFTSITDDINDIQLALKTKIDAADTYNRTTIDAKIAGIPIPTLPDMTKYYTKTDVDLLMNDKAKKNHGHVATDISQDSSHRFVTDDEITAWNNKAEALKYTAENVANKGIPNGYASLGSDGKVPLSQLPAFTTGIGSGGIEYINNYIQLQKIDDPDQNKIYIVLNASDDSSVKSGWAEYVYDSSKWLKIAEQESIDMVVDWADVTNKPTYFPVDPTLFNGLARTGSSGDVYSKSEVDNLLKLKSDATHNHDGVYVTPAALNTKLADYVLDTDARLHPSAKLGSYLVDETNMQDGYVLTYSAENGNLRYTKPATSSSSTTGTTTVDYYKLGNYRVSEPATMIDGTVLTYNGTSGGLEYRTIDEGKVGTHTVDESDMGKNKALVYDGKALVYKQFADNLVDIDDTDKADGKILQYSAADKKLKYVDMPKANTSTGTGPSIFRNTYNGAGGNLKIVYRASDKDAIKKIDVNIDALEIYIDTTKDLYSLQFMTPQIKNGDKGEYDITLHYLDKDGNRITYDYNNFIEALTPVVQFAPSNNTRMSSYIFYGGTTDLDVIKFTGFDENEVGFVKMVF